MLSFHGSPGHKRGLGVSCIRLICAWTELARPSMEPRRHQGGGGGARQLKLWTRSGHGDLLSHADDDDN
jgi:hypothetical protein